MQLGLFENHFRKASMKHPTLTVHPTSKADMTSGVEVFSQPAIFFRYNLSFSFSLMSNALENYWLIYKLRQEQIIKQHKAFMALKCKNIGFVEVKLLIIKIHR